MLYKEEKRDLFSVPGDYYLAHCISADFELGAGIALQFVARYNVKEKLKSDYPFYLMTYRNNFWKGDCIATGKVFNLITKERYFQKPTYESIRRALESCKILCKGQKIARLAMPRIGCGLDQLEWQEVSQIIKDVFNDMNIEILICYQ